MVTIGLTGTLGSGKTAVLEMFKKLGARTLNSDIVAHEELKRNKSLSEILRKEFGSSIFEKGRINNKRLAEMVFFSKENISKLNSLIHPLVKNKIKSFLDKSIKAHAGQVAVVEVPLLFECGMESLFDVTITVVSESRVLKERVIKSDRFSATDLKIRMRYQFLSLEKEARCNFIIDNSATKAQTFKQVRELMGFLKNTS